MTPSNSSKAAAVDEPSAGVKSIAPKFKERPNPIKSKKRLKSDYENARERQKFLINRKKQKRDDEALKKKSRLIDCFYVISLSYILLGIF